MITMKKVNEVMNLHGSDSKKFEVEDLSISLSLKSNYSSSITTTTTKSSDSNFLSPSTSTCHASCTCYKCHRRNCIMNTISNQSISSLKKTTTTPSARKTPNLKSYDKHLPKATYAQQDSIYRFDQQTTSQDTKEIKQDLTDLLKQKDSYKISWKEGDVLPSLVTLKIFEEKGHNDNEGLSDLLEQRAKELKQMQKEPIVTEIKEELPPRQPDCITLSYRDGPQHIPLTLFHTMKMKSEQERLNAYRVAYKHCVHANSGLTSWLKRSRHAPTRDAVKWIPARKPTLKRSLFSPRRQRSMNEPDRKRSVDMISAPVHLMENNDTKVSFDSIRLPDVKDACSISSVDSGPKLKHQRTGRIILSSLSRKSSKRSQPSFEKTIEEEKKCIQISLPVEQCNQ